MGHISVVHKNVTFISDVFLLQIFKENLTKQQNFKLKYSKFKKVGWPTLRLRGSYNLLSKFAIKEENMNTI